MSENRVINIEGTLAHKPKLQTFATVKGTLSEIYITNLKSTSNYDTDPLLVTVYDPSEDLLSEEAGTHIKVTASTRERFHIDDQHPKMQLVAESVSL